jgi:NTE family protein
MRASMAVPGVFAPVTIDGRPLVDGGISENLAIGAATRDRPVRLIAVDIASRPLPVEELSSPASVLNQAVTLLMMRENARQVDRLGPGDLLIQPALGEFSSSAFALAADAIAIGEQSARAEVDRLREYAVPVDEYAAWREGRSVPPAAAPRIAAVEVRGPDVAAARAARRRLEKLVGDALDEAQLRREVERARATDLFESVDLVLDLEGASDVRVVLDLEPRTRGADALLFGLRLRDDFEGGTSFDVGARWLNRGVGSHDLDLRVDVVGGERQRAALSAFRPVGDEHLWFVESGGGYREEPFVLFVDATTFFQFRRRDLFAFVDFGTDLGSWGEARLGVEQRWSRLRRSSELGLQIGQLRFDETLGRLRFGVDTFDEVTFPSTGTYVRAELARVFATDLDERGVVFAELVAQRAASFGAHRFVGGLELQDNLDGTPVFPRAAAGGLFRLSGYAENELRGSKLAIAHLRWARELAGSGARMPIFAGASLELGDVLSEAQDWDVDALRLAGSLYLGIDSVLGPVFIHVGLAEEGRRSWAFSLGRRLF